MFISLAGSPPLSRSNKLLRAFVSISLDIAGGRRLRAAGPILKNDSRDARFIREPPRVLIGRFRDELKPSNQRVLAPSRY